MLLPSVICPWIRSFSCGVFNKRKTREEKYEILLNYQEHLIYNNLKQDWFIMHEGALRFLSYQIFRCACLGFSEKLQVIFTRDVLQKRFSRVAVAPALLLLTRWKENELGDGVLIVSINGLYWIYSLKRGSVSDIFRKMGRCPDIRGKLVPPSGGQDREELWLGWSGAALP